MNVLLRATATQGSSGARKKAPSGIAEAAVTAAPRRPSRRATVLSWDTWCGDRVRMVMIEAPSPNSVMMVMKPR